MHSRPCYVLGACSHAEKEVSVNGAANSQEVAAADLVVRRGIESIRRSSAANIEIGVSLLYRPVPDVVGRTRRGGESAGRVATQETGV